MSGEMGDLRKRRKCNMAGTSFPELHDLVDVAARLERICEGVPLELTLPVAAERLACRALGERGERKASAAVRATDAGAVLAVGHSFKTVWYELSVW